MITMTPELLDLHKQNGFYIRVRPLKTGIGCFAEFPRTREKKPFIAAYVVDNNDLKVIIEKDGESGKSDRLTLPQIYMRSIIALDILCMAKKYSIAKELIVVDDGVSITDIVKIDNLESEVEHRLGHYAGDLFCAESTDKPHYSEVKDDYRILCKRIITNGGICNS